MIKIDENNGHIEGTLSLILAELTIAIKSVNDAIKEDVGEEIAKKLIKHSYEMAFKTEEVEDTLKKLLKLLAEDND